MKKTTWATGVILILIAGYIGASPYITVYNLKSSVAEQNATKLSDDIDFIQLRQNIKDQLNIAMAKDAVDNIDDNPFALLAVGFVSKMVDGLVESYITPAGISAMMTGNNPPSSADNNQNMVSTQNDQPFENARLKYESFSRFTVAVNNNENKETLFVLKRDGITWKLVNIILPMKEK